MLVNELEAPHTQSSLPRKDLGFAAEINKRSPWAVRRCVSWGWVCLLLGGGENAQVFKLGLVKMVAGSPGTYGDGQDTKSFFSLWLAL